MKAIVLNSFASDFSGLEVKEVPKPSPKPGEVLIKVEAGGLTPADDMLMRDVYFEQRQKPYVAGYMGLGTVVSSGGGFMGRMNKGKRVFFSPGMERGGTWAEYAIADAMMIAPIGDLAPQEGVGMANSLTAIGLFDTAHSLGAKAVIMNAAAGSLGRYMNVLSLQLGVPLINIIRSDQQKEILSKLGAKYILNQNDPNFDQKLGELANQLGATFAVDSVAAEAPRQIMRVMPPKSTIVSIGSLSGEDVKLDPLQDLMRYEQNYGVFVVSRWLETKNLFGTLKQIGAARKLATSLGEQNTVRKTVSLEDAVANMSGLVKDTSRGIVLISPTL